MARRSNALELTLCHWVSAQWEHHGTKLLGSLSAAIPGLLAIDGFIPKGKTKYWLALNVVLGALTVHRGFVNSRNSRDSQ